MYDLKSGVGKELASPEALLVSSSHLRHSAFLATIEMKCTLLHFFLVSSYSSLTPDLEYFPVACATVAFEASSSATASVKFGLLKK